jgi:methionyl-tRNA formyltransferase
MIEQKIKTAKPGNTADFPLHTRVSPRIVFMGTPDFAVASLDRLVSAGYTIAGVVTAPDKPAGRGMQLQEAAVKTYALAKALPILQPDKLKAPAFIEQLEALRADLQVVVAFRMLPEIVWNMPPMGTINLHGSLLPQYRGAAPINWAIINGERETGVTSFKLQHEIDTGNILLSARIPI